MVVKLKKNQLNFFFVLMGCIIFISARLPFFINPQQKMFENFAEEIAKTFPENIEILVYHFNLINGTDELENKLFYDFYTTITNYESKYQYSILFETEAIEKAKEIDENIDLTFLRTQDELELITFGKFLNQEAVLLSSITVIEGKKRKVFDKKTKRWITKKTGLFQGNFFNTETSQSILRFSYYFLINGPEANNQK